MNLHRSLENLLVLQQLLPSLQSPMLQTIHEAWIPQDVSSWIADTIVIPNPPLSAKEGGIIRRGEYRTG